MFSLSHDRYALLSWFTFISTAVLVIDGRVIYDKSVRAGSVEIFWTLEGFNIAMAIVAPGSGYVSIGFSKDEKMIGSQIVLGWVAAKSSSVAEYNILQKNATGITALTPSILQNASAVELNGETIVRFERALSHEGRISINPAKDVRLIWAFHHTEDKLKKHTAAGSLVVNLLEGLIKVEDNDYAQVVHGVLMWCSFGVLMPISILATLFKTLNWKKVHISSQIVSFFVILASIVIIIERKIRDESKHFQGLHGITGIVIVFLLLLNVGSNLFRVSERNPQRLFWVFSHVWIGRVLFLLGIGNIGTGILNHQQVTGDYSSLKWLLVANLISVGLFLVGFVALYLAFRHKSQNAESS